MSLADNYGDSPPSSPRARPAQPEAVVGNDMSRYLPVSDRTWLETFAVTVNTCEAESLSEHWREGPATMFGMGHLPVPGSGDPNEVPLPPVAGSGRYGWVLRLPDKPIESETGTEGPVWSLWRTLMALRAASVATVDGPTVSRDRELTAGMYPMAYGGRLRSNITKALVQWREAACEYCAENLDEDNADAVAAMHETVWNMLTQWILRNGHHRRPYDYDNHIVGLVEAALDVSDSALFAWAEDIELAEDPEFADGRWSLATQCGQCEYPFDQCECLYVVDLSRVVTGTEYASVSVGRRNSNGVAKNADSVHEEAIEDSDGGYVEWSSPDDWDTDYNGTEVTDTSPQW